MANRKISDWQKSPGHILLLTTFVEVRDPNASGKRLDWRLLLGQNIEKAIEHLVEANALASASLIERVVHRFKLRQLRAMLKERGLRTSGRKADLALRLIENDFSAMEIAVSDLTLLKCTQIGLAAIEEHWATIRQTESEHVNSKLPRKQVNQLCRWLLKTAAAGVLGAASYDAIKQYVRRNQHYSPQSKKRDFITRKPATSGASRNLQLKSVAHNRMRVSPFCCSPFLRDGTIIVSDATMDSIVSICDEIVSRSNEFHIAGLAQIVEDLKRCFIRFMTSDDRRIISQGPTLISQRMRLTLEVRGNSSGHDHSISIFEHFVFYSQDIDSKLSQFTAFHGLGHIFLHWPLNDLDERMTILPGSYSGFEFFHIGFTDEEHEEADLFAAYMTLCNFQVLSGGHIEGSKARMIEHIEDLAGRRWGGI